MIHQRTNSKAACKQQVKKSNDEDTPISPNSPHDVGHIQKKLMQILKPQQGKIYSPKNPEAKQFKTGYCISLGNLVAQQQKTLFKSTTSSKSHLHQNLTVEDNKMRKIKSPKQPQAKVLVPRINIQKQNLFGLIKSINNFMSQSRQKQTDDLQLINDYLEKKDNLVRSYDTREVSERASVVQFFKKIAHPESCTQLQSAPISDFCQSKQVKKSVDDKVLQKNKMKQKKEPPDQGFQEEGQQVQNFVIQFLGSSIETNKGRQIEDHIQPDVLGVGCSQTPRAPMEIRKRLPIKAGEVLEVVVYGQGQGG